MKTAHSIFILLALSSSLRAQQLIKAEAAAPVLPVPVEQLTETEFVQQTISLHLARSDAEQSKKLRQNMDIVIGDVRRVAGLPKERLRVLEVAAKGAVDGNLEGWRTAQENQVRQQATGLSPKVVQQRLDSIGMMATGSEPPTENALWKGTLDTVLTPDERARWTQAEKGRDAYRLQAIAKLLVAELDRQLDLTLTQIEKLEPMTSKAVQDYLPDMANFIDRGNGIDFRMLLLILTAVPPFETQSILTPSQFDKWNQVTADYKGWWQSVEQNHKARIQSGGAVPNLQQRNNGGIILRNGGRIMINGGGLILKK